MIRSRPSRGLSFVRFMNITQRKVDVIWINYEGARVRYKTLEPQEFVDVNKTDSFNKYIRNAYIFLIN